MCRMTCCPSLTLRSFTAIITIVDIVVFIITLTYGIQPNSDFLTPKYETLDDFGSRIVCKILKQYQLWRFLTPVFLHGNFLHIVFNIMSQLIIGSQVENMMGIPRFILVYFLSGIGGNVLGVLISDSSAVGASTAIVGLLGVFIAYVIVNWNRLDPSIKCFMLCMISFIILINLAFGLGGSTDQKESRIDNVGHLGGLLTGVFAGMFLINPLGGAPGLYEKRAKITGVCMTCFFFILCLALAFTVKNPKC